MPQANIQKIVKEIHENVIKNGAKGVIEYSWYDASSKQISPMKIGIDCSVLRTMSADFCIKNTQAVLKALQMVLPDALIDLDIHNIRDDDGDVVKPVDFHTRTRATNELKADVRALGGTDGLLERMAHIQYNRRTAQTSTYEAIPAKGPYPYIVVDWTEDEDEDEDKDEDEDEDKDKDS